jgi:hypothetical protein
MYKISIMKKGVGPRALGSPLKQTKKTEGEKKAERKMAQVRISADSTKLFNEQNRYPEWMRGIGGAEARAEAAGRIAREKEAKRKNK